jgi:hypothetical protein
MDMKAVGFGLQMKDLQNEVLFTCVLMETLAFA